MYEWDYARQLLHLRALEASGAAIDEDELYSDAVPREAPAPARARARERDAAGPADRRGRPRRRRVRGVPARAALRLDDLGARARCGARRRAAGRGAHLEPHARRARRAEAPLPLPLDPASRLRARARDHPPARARGRATRSRATSRPRSRCCAISSSTSRRVSPRRSTGRSRWRRSAPTRLDERSVDATLGTILKYHEDHARVRAHGLGELVRGRGRAAPDRGHAHRRPRDRPAPDRVAVAFARVLRGAGRRGAGRLDDRVRPRARARRPRDRVAASTGPGRATLVRRPDDIAAVRPRLRRVLGRRRPGGPRRRRRAGAARRPPRSTSSCPTPTPRTRSPDVRPSVTVRWSPVETLRDRDFASYTAGGVRAGPPADGRSAAHGRAAPVAPAQADLEIARLARSAPHGPAVAARGRRGRAAGVPHDGHALAAARAAPRRERVDGAVRRGRSCASCTRPS